MLLTRTLLGIPLAIWIQSALGYEAFRAQVSMPGILLQLLGYYENEVNKMPVAVSEDV